MEYIAEKFKDAKPEDTVKKIKGILDDLGIRVYETWYDSGLENCHSVSVSAEGGVPMSSGKGVTKALAQASAYGEFIERLQGGLHMYKYQSLNRAPHMNMQAYAPDARYMTVEELIENGEWMDPIIRNHKNKTLDRAAIARLCKIYAGSPDGKILTLPFYSLFEKKYVYLPIDFVDQIYGSNGCCAGNSREEAWVHALSEIIERHATIQVLASGQAVPTFPDEVIEKYPLVAKIVKQIKDGGEFDIDISDYSLGLGYPVVGVTIINKKNHSYRIKVAADPIFEIAIQRNFTELFQGVNLTTVTPRKPSILLKKITDFPIYNNTLNQLETSNGLYTADYFVGDAACATDPKEFGDNINKNNQQLLEYALDVFRRENRQVYVRNFSYLGFHSYRFVVPGFSEANASKFDQVLSEQSVADYACEIFRKPQTSSMEELAWIIAYSNMLKHTTSRYWNLGHIAGVPLADYTRFLPSLTRSYVCYRSGSYSKAIEYLDAALTCCDEADTDYLVCINQYLGYKNRGFAEDKIKAIIYKFFTKSVADRLYGNLENGRTPYDDFLLTCDYQSCDTCKYRKHCCYENVKRMYQIVGEKYRNFVHGQDESEFQLS